MASNLIFDSVLHASASKEVVFAGDGVTLGGQIDYPMTKRPVNGYPLIFVLHHACCNTREDYTDYAQVALDKGFAVFRWDKRGTGRSGASGRGSTTQDAVNAYEIALTQPSVNRKQAVILGVGAGSALLGSCFGLFARLQHPYGAMLIANMLDPEEVLAIDTRTLILMGEDDWNSATIYGEAAAAAHNQTYKHGSTYSRIRGADRLLMSNGVTLHFEARKVMGAWLNSLRLASTSI